MAESTHNSVPSRHLNCVNSRSFDPKHKWNSTPGPCVPSPRAASTAPDIRCCCFRFVCCTSPAGACPGAAQPPRPQGRTGDLCHIPVVSPISLPPWTDNDLSQLQGVCPEQRGVITHHPAASGFLGSRTGLSVLLLLCLPVSIYQDFCN